MASTTQMPSVPDDNQLMTSPASPDQTGYTSPIAHLDDYLERVRLLLARHIVRHSHRLLDIRGRLSNLFVSLDEVRAVLAEVPSTNLAPPTGLPTLEKLDEQLRAHEQVMFSRLASADPDITFPIEDIRAILKLSQIELDTLLVAAATQIDLGLGRIATHAWADFTLKRPTMKFLAEVVGSTRQGYYSALSVGRPDHVLRALRVIALEDGGNNVVTPEQELRVRVPDRVISFIKGDTKAPYDDLDLHGALVKDPLTLGDLGLESELADRFRKAVSRLTRRTEGSAVLVLTGPEALDYGKVVRACLGKNTPVLEVRLDLETALPDGEPARFDTYVRTAFREARLQQAVAVLNIGGLSDDDRIRPHVSRALRRALPHAGGLVCVVTRRLSASLTELLDTIIEISIPMPAPGPRAELWKRALSGAELEATDTGDTIELLAHQYVLSAEDIAAASRAAVVAAEMRGNGRAGPVSLALSDIKVAVRQRVEHKLGALAEPFSTPLTFDDIVLPEDLHERLQEIVTYGINMRKVHEQWGFDRINAYGRGLTALFDGPPGTGKTLSAAIIAHEMGVELYRVDLSRIVDKYIGETEKNLARIFDEAERSKAMLLFDEADSLFGQRTSIKSSNDRYANLEVNYLLQRMEHFDGTSVLTSNFGESIDDAFLRRIRFKVTFRIPDEEGRLELWQKLIPEEAPIGDDIKFDKLAKEFEMAPGHIKNAVMRAAFRAAQADSAITYDILRDAARVEYRELGNLVRE